MAELVPCDEVRRGELVAQEPVVFFLLKALAFVLCLGPVRKGRFLRWLCTIITNPFELNLLHCCVRLQFF